MDATDAQPQPPGHCCFCAGEDLKHTLDFALNPRDDIDRLILANSIQFAAQLGNVSAKIFDRLGSDRKVPLETAGRKSTGSSHRQPAIGKRLSDLMPGKQFISKWAAFEILSGLLSDLPRFQLDHQRALRQKFCEVNSVVKVGSQNGDFDFGQIGHASLRTDFELADRFDLVIEQLDSNRQQPIGREHVKDPAPHRKLAGQFDHRGLMKPVLD